MFTRDYPIHAGDGLALLSTPERTGALPDYTGRGVVMAFIDSGFFPHPDLDGRVLVHTDATENRVVEGTRFTRPEWYSWHGQMTSVIAAGDGRTSGGRYRGIACDAQLVLIKVSNRRGAIKEREILRGLTWLIDNRRRFNVRVLNLSVGGDHPSNDRDHPIYSAIRTLTGMGVTVMVAAGNSANDCLVPPASAAEAITVGGYNDQNSRDPSLWIGYSNNYGVGYDGSRKPEVIAPAMWIASPILPGSTVEREARWLAALLDISRDDHRVVRRVLRDGHADLSIPRSQALKPNVEVYSMLQARIRAHKIIDAHHQHVDGTSVSVAIASSIVAQMVQANPDLTPRDIKAILTRTAELIPGIPAEHQGAGRIDAARAVSAAGRTKTSGDLRT